MKKKYITPRIKLLSIDVASNTFLAGSGNPDTGMTIPKDPVPGVSGDAKPGTLDFEFHIDLPEE
ncbi:MAG: hypothetical protein NC344_04175 [Bacteroidales bacterium]|nr:hypothetical protein [Bacteroidales bacterium]MCM1147025.1 hypothetical protein [Bacteroidales bacterium]MCM1205842.1 hypothetical protein [Bacillota bacterium]MCM1509916.1 hypothetical protein [Clostridium sp.]